MTLPIHPNRITLSMIRGEFGGPSSPISLSTYYRGGSFVPPTTIGYPKNIATLIPANGTISLGNFHGSRLQQLSVFYNTGYFTAPPGASEATVLLVAGGGAGGWIKGNSIEGGGGGGAGGVIYTTVSLSPGARYLIQIGQGGVNPGPEGIGDGGNTSAFGLTAIGGGTGGPTNMAGVVSYTGRFGGSGGGGSAYYSRSTWSGYVPGQGNSGHPGIEESSSGGGGGAGGNGSLIYGGEPVTHVMLGTTFVVGQGGQGGTWGSTTNNGGGGNVGISPDGKNGTGGGGTGGGSKRSQPGNGGSGMVAILC